MATPRKRWFKCADSLLREPWPREEKLALVLLMAHLNTRWARDGISADEAGNALLSKGAVQDIAGLRGFRVLSSLSQRVSFSVSREGEFVRLEWPKFAIFQEYGSRSPGSDEAGDEPSPAPAPSPTPKQEKKEEPPTPVAAAPVAAASSEGAILSIHRGDPTKEAVRKIWPEVQKAAAQYGKRWQTLTPDRLSKLAARLREHGPDPQVLVKAVHGAVAYWKKTMPDKDMSQYIATDTIYGASKFSKYIEFACDPKTAPKKDWEDMTPEERREMSARIFAR